MKIRVTVETENSQTAAGIYDVTADVEDLPDGGYPGEGVAKAALALISEWPIALGDTIKIRKA